jgi:peptidase E
MTKFILHGGFNKDVSFIKDEFFQEVLKDTPSEVKLLLVFFAEREDLLELRISQSKEQFEKNKGSKNINIKIASDDAFIEECKWADVICIHGGRTVKLIEAFKKFKNLEQVFAGKIIAGDSAGVNVLCHLFYSKTSKEIGEGLGILPFKVIVHYADGTPNPLENIEPDLETLFLHEYETKVFYK